MFVFVSSTITVVGARSVSLVTTVVPVIIVVMILLVVCSIIVFVILAITIRRRCAKQSNGKFIICYQFVIV